MVDVARHAGVSLKTVSRVINNAPYVQQDLVDRVLASAAALGFRRNHNASTLRSGQHTATVGLIIEELANPFYSTVAHVAAEVARQHGTLLITASSEEDPDREQHLLRDLCARRVDGLLIVPTAADHGFLRSEVELGVPVVFLDRPATGLDADTVLLDNAGGAYAGVRTLIDAGHTRIAMLHDSLSVYTMAERLAGALDALRDSGLPTESALIRGDAGDPDAAAAAVADLLDGPRPPTAFFALNNRITIGALRELWRRRSDAGLVGFDDFELSHLMPRPFTLVAYDVREYARRAAELLFGRIGGDSSQPRRVVMPTRLVEHRPA
jgi:LacI family transcriptional regulator